MDEGYKMNVKLAKVDKTELLSVKNPGYEKLIREYDHLRGVTMDDQDTKQRLPIHLILGNGEYSRINPSTKRLVGREDGGPVAEKTKSGWFIMSPGIDFDRSTMLLTQTSQSDFENLCRLDVLGLADSMENDQNLVYEDFKEQLTKLPTNEAGSRRRLTSWARKLTREGNYDRYDGVIKEQLNQGIIEPAPNEAKGKEFYPPHKGVFKQSAETTKLRIVYDASAKETSDKPSLNECLHPGPPLQSQLWNVLVRARFHPILLTGDIEKAFLQVRIKEEERDSLRFFWPEESKL